MQKVHDEFAPNRVVSTVQFVDRKIASNPELREKLHTLRAPSELNQKSFEQLAKLFLESRDELSPDEIESGLSYMGKTLDEFNANPLPVKLSLAKIAEELLWVKAMTHFYKALSIGMDVLNKPNKSE